MSKPIMLTSFMDGPCSVGCPTRQLWHIDAVKRGPSTHHCEPEAEQSRMRAQSRHWIASAAMPPRNDDAYGGASDRKRTLIRQHLSRAAEILGHVLEFRQPVLHRDHLVFVEDVQRGRVLEAPEQVCIDIDELEAGM